MKGWQRRVLIICVVLTFRYLPTRQCICSLGNGWCHMHLWCNLFNPNKNLLWQGCMHIVTHLNSRHCLCYCFPYMLKFHRLFFRILIFMNIFRTHAHFNWWFLEILGCAIFEDLSSMLSVQFHQDKSTWQWSLFWKISSPNFHHYGPCTYLTLWVP